MSSAKPILLDVPEPGDDGYAFLEHDGTQRIGWHVHTGARVAWAKPAWANGRLLIHVKGGTTTEQGFEDEGAAFLVTPAELLALTDAMFSIGFDMAAAEVRP